MRTILTLILSASLLPLSALGGHSETHDTGWFEYVWNDDDTEVIRCDALDAISVGDELYIHDRNAMSHNPIGEDGIWTYMESNNIEGLQIGGSGLIPTVPDRTGEYPYLVTFDDHLFSGECPNGDTVLL